MRHEFLLSRDRAAVLVIDVQERLLSEIPRRDEILRRAEKLCRAASILKLPAIVTEQNSNVFGPTAPPLRAALAGVAPVEKMAFSCVELLRETLAKLARPQLLIFGLETHICVCQSALDAVAAGFDVHVAFDACGSRSEPDHAVGVEKMKAGGVVPSSTEVAIYDLLERAGTAEFRAILPLLKEK